MGSGKRGRPKTGRAYNGFGVYKITCLENGRFYIGGYNTVYNRLCNQKFRLRTANPACVPDMLSDFQKFGESAFKFEIIKHCESRVDFLRDEQRLIMEHFDNGLLYNNRNAYLEKTLKTKNAPRSKRFTTTLPDRQKEWLTRESEKLNITLAYFLEKLVDQSMLKQKTNKNLFREI